MTQRIMIGTDSTICKEETLAWEYVALRECIHEDHAGELCFATGMIVLGKNNRLILG